MTLKLHVWRRPWSLLAGFTQSSCRTPRPSIPPLLIAVEGQNDIHFLRRISVMLHAADPARPELAHLEQRGAITLVATGGGNLFDWSLRLAPLAPRQFHLYDREQSPEAEWREQLIELVNLRPGCRALLTRKRSLENYLHPMAILEASGIAVDFGDEEDVAELVARRLYCSQGKSLAWDAIPPRSRRRRRNRAKGWLNTLAVERMTPERLAERDTEAEVVGWLAAIAHMAS